MNKETILSIDLTDVFSVENKEKLDMLSKNLLIELLLRNLDRIIKSQEKISKALDYIEKIYKSDTEIVLSSQGEHIDVGYATPALEDIEKILKGDE